MHACQQLIDLTGEVQPTLPGLEEVAEGVKLTPGQTTYINRGSYVIRGTYKQGKPCNIRCQSSKSDRCECSCGGHNHGTLTSAWIVHKNNNKG